MADLRKLLEEARLQIVYLHEKFQATGSGNAVVAKIEAALAAVPAVEWDEHDAAAGTEAKIGPLTAHVCESSPGVWCWSVRAEGDADTLGLAKAEAESAAWEAFATHKCPVYAKCCADHGFVHGAEAEELREGIEKMIERYGEKKVSTDALQTLLDGVDARDSLAYGEARDAEAVNRG